TGLNGLGPAGMEEATAVPSAARVTISRACCRNEKWNQTPESPLDRASGAPIPAFSRVPGRAPTSHWGLAPASRIELGLVFFENQFHDTVIVLGSEAVAMGPYKLGASVFGLYACQVNPDYLSPDFGRAQVQIASSHDCAKLV